MSVFTSLAGQGAIGSALGGAYGAASGPEGQTPMSRVKRGLIGATAGGVLGASGGYAGRQLQDAFKATKPLGSASGGVGASAGSGFRPSSGPKRLRPKPAPTANTGRQPPPAAEAEMPVSSPPTSKEMEEFGFNGLSPEEIRKRSKRVMAEFHPDRLQNATPEARSAADAKFRRVVDIRDRALAAAASGDSQKVASCAHEMLMHAFFSEVAKHASASATSRLRR